MSQLTGGRLLESLLIILNAQVIEVHIAPRQEWQWRNAVDAPESGIAAGFVVEGISFDIHRLGGEGVEAQSITLVDEPCAIKTQAGVRRLAHGHESLRAKIHFLTPAACGHRAFGFQIQLHVEESLVQVEDIFIGRTWPASSTVLQRAHELAEDSERVPVMQIAGQKKTLEQITVRVLRAESPIRVLVVFVFLTNLAPEAGKPVFTFIQAYVFRSIEKIAPPRRVTQVAVILVVSGGLEGRWTLRRFSFCGLKLESSHRQKPEQRTDYHTAGLLMQVICVLDGRWLHKGEQMDL